MSTPKTLVTPELFVPAELVRYIGQDRRPARIKMSPEDFRVEERQGQNELCTVRPESDMVENFEFPPASGKPGLVSLTLVKRQLTTFAAVYQAARLLGVDRKQITYAGLKDRWALTAQRIVVQGMSLDHARRNCFPEAIRGAGFFLKDAAPATHTLDRGRLQANRFTLNVQVPGLTASQILEYVQPKLDYLAAQGWMMPNLYGRQRLGRRQNLYHIGETLIREGAEKAIRRFLCETSPNERPQASELRKQMDGQWYYFDRIKSMLAPVHSQLNMDVEYKIACLLEETGSFSEVMHAMPQEFSLWVGAYQSYWFNQALAGVLRGEIGLGNGGSIPLWVNDPEAERFYRRHLPEAVDGNIDPEVKRLFLTPGRNRRGQVSRPWRKALIPVLGLEHSADDGVWHCQFELRSGAYATTLLSLLFDIDQDDESDDRPRYKPDQWRPRR